MRLSSIRFLLVAVAALFATNSANALLVDYLKLDVGATGQRVETGFQELSGSGNGNASLGPVALASDLGDALTVELSNVNAGGANSGGLDFRDRGNSTSVESLSQVGEDFVKNNSGIIRMTITGLQAGTYNATSYHVDSNFTQSNPIQLSVSVDGAGFRVDPATGNAGANVGGVNNLTTAIMDASAANFSFITDGTGPVILLWDGDALSGDNEAPLNGLVLQFDQPIPEPTTATLAMLGLAGLASRRRRVA